MSGKKTALLICGICILASALLYSLTPMLNRAREVPGVTSANDLREIGRAAMMYANAHSGNFPDSEKTLIENEDIAFAVFVSSRNPAVMPAGGDLDKQVQWINEHGDYAWTGAGLNSTSSAPGSVLAYEKPADWNEGSEVLFADGHVDWVARVKANAMISDLKQGKNPPPSLASR